MPVHRGKDSKGTFYQYGSQKKYYFKPGNPNERQRAKHKAHQQATAIRANGGGD